MRDSIKRFKAQYPKLSLLFELIIGITLTAIFLAVVVRVPFYSLVIYIVASAIGTIIHFRIRFK